LNRNIITIATGKKLYMDLAVNLARSFFLWHRSADISFYIVTDNPQLFPDDITKLVKIITIKPGELGEGFSPKLYLDKLAPDGQTLFIDSDCLIFGDLSFIFKQFKGHSVSVVGNYIEDGEWFGDVAAICRRFNIPHLPKFNGGIYYLENGPEAVKVYNKARELEKQYDQIGFRRLRNRPNDEVLMALAMQLYNQKPVDDDGTIMAEFVNFQSGIKSDLLSGTVELYNTPSHPNYQPSWHLQVAKPQIVHFLGHHNKLIPYIKEARQLKYIFEDKFSERKSRALTFTVITLPFKMLLYSKRIFRPLYHSIMGVRKIKKSERIID